VLKLSSRWKLRNGTSWDDTRHVRKRPHCLTTYRDVRGAHPGRVWVKLGTSFVLLLEIALSCAHKKLDFVVLLYRHYKTRQCIWCSIREYLPRGPTLIPGRGKSFICFPKLLDRPGVSLIP
jgi:hypothetical protein